MPIITEKTTTPPLLNLQRIGHGTLAVIDLAKTRAFFEELMGFDVIQTSPISLMIRKGTDHVYAVVEVGDREDEMDRFNHNGVDVGSIEEVDKAFEIVSSVKEKYGIREIRKPGIRHGDYSFFFCDRDGNWWEIVKVREGGYAADFGDPERDLTGLGQELAGRRGVRVHTHDEEFRDSIRDARAAQSERQ